MSLSNFRKRGQEPAQPERDERRCIADGCPCRASVSVEGGRWVCSAHAYVASDRWPTISEKLRDNDWLIGFIDEVAKLDRNPPRDSAAGWRAFATQFWSESDAFCVPHAQEEASPYLNRMRGELLWRCGAQPKRPQVRLPQEPRTRAGNLSALLGRAVA